MNGIERSVQKMNGIERNELNGIERDAQPWVLDVHATCRKQVKSVSEPTMHIILPFPGMLEKALMGSS